MFPYVGGGFADAPGRALARRAPWPRPANLVGGSEDRTRQVRLVAATTSALRLRFVAMPSSPKNSPGPSRPTCRRPALLSCHTPASPDQLKNTSAASPP